MKPETEIRNLKRYLAEVRRDYLSMQETARALRRRAESSEREVAEWKARFDILLRREEPKP